MMEAVVDNRIKIRLAQRSPVSLAHHKPRKVPCPIFFLFVHPAPFRFKPLHVRAWYDGFMLRIEFIATLAY